MEGEREKVGLREAATFVCGANGGRGGDAGCEGGRVLYVCRRDGVIDGEGETVGAREAETYACADARW